MPIRVCARRTAEQAACRKIELRLPLQFFSQIQLQNVADWRHVT